MKVYFEPIKLISLKATIFQNTRKSKNVENIPNGEIEKLLEEISKLDINQILGYSDVLTSKQVDYLALHLSSEKNIHLFRKIFKILEYRISQEVFDCFYIGWQNHYDSQDNIQVLLDLSKDSKYLEKYSLSYETLKSCITSQNILESLCKLAIATSKQQSITFQESISKLGIKDYSRIGLSLGQCYYLCCDAKAYLSLTDSQLCNIVTANSSNRKFTFEQKCKFFLNFLTVMNFSTNGTKDLNDYLQLATEGKHIIGEIGTTKFNAFFEKVPYILKVKCNKWFSCLEIDKNFGNGERGQFWKARAIEYDVKKVYKKSSYDLVVMEFENFTAIEFLQNADGCIYIFSSQNTKRMFRDWLCHGYSKTEFKSKLFKEYKKYISNDKKSNGFYRQTHQGNGWRNKILQHLKSISYPI